MNETRDVLRQIGWGDELIEAFLVPAPVELPAQDEVSLTTVESSDCSELVVAFESSLVPQIR